MSNEAEFRTQALAFFSLPPSYNAEQLRAAYYNLARKYHPDAGGTAADFQTVQKIFKWLEKDMLKRPVVRTPAEMRAAIEKHTTKKEDDPEVKRAVMSKFESRGKFNLQKFNQVFMETHVRDPDDTEAATWLKSDEDIIRPDTPVNKTNFDEQFRKMTSRLTPHDAIQVVPGSISLVSHSNSEIFERGGRHTTDMAGRVIGIGGNQLAFTDVRDAHSASSMISAGAAAAAPDRSYTSYKREYSAPIAFYGEHERARIKAEEEKVMRQEEARRRAWEEQNRLAEERAKLLRRRLGQ
ncbi:MAG: hypothetical protein F2563_02400 [Actinobacteria bacterium]|uniref:Unannotated protein n=1 Tax=freshwater metagenome TaxID=449393 RepID=A0A6J6EC28_9ZZZZ|nr:hypothetical protein [Actinomycetota bacterium]